MTSASPRRLGRLIALGLLFGLVGVAVDAAVYYGCGCYSVIGFRDAATVCAAFYFGTVPGLVSGVVCALGRLALPVFGEGLCAVLQGPVASLATTAMALATVRWIFNGKRPSLGPAALFGAFTGACHVGAVFILGLDDVGRTLISISESLPWNLSIPALGAALGSLACRVPRSRRADTVSLLSALALAAVCGAVFWAQGRSSVTSAHEASESYVRDVKSAMDAIVHPRYRGIECIFENWHVGETGSIFLVDPRKDAIVSGQKRSICSHSATHAGFGDLTFPTTNAFARGRVLNWDDRREDEVFCDALVRRVAFPEVGYTAYVVLPTADVFYPRDLTFFLTLVVLVLVYAFGAALFMRIVRQGAAIDALRAKEDARLRRDLELAKSIQLSSVPSAFTPFPDSNELDLFATMRTAREVGGDFYDFYPVGARKLALVIADVSDKGVPAALFMMKAKGVLHEVALTAEDLAAAMASANDALCEDNAAGMFVTAWLGVFDLDTGVLDYVSAGHNPPMLRRENGQVETLAVPKGLVLACRPGSAYEVRTVTLKAGDRLFLYTDGVTEAKSADGAFYGERRLAAALAAADADSRAVCARIVADVDAFAAKMPQADDITVFSVGWRGRAPVQTRAFPATLEGLADATDFLRRTLETAECQKKTKTSLMVAMDEIASNIVRYSGAPDFTVRVALEANPPVVRVVFSDAGKPYNPLEQADPDVTLSVEDREIGGLGLFMVRKMMDEVAYAHVDGRNILTIGKRRF